MNAGRPTQFQQGPEVQAHNAVNSQKLVGSANIVQPTCPGGCGAQSQPPPSHSQHQVHASHQPQAPHFEQPEQPQIHQPSQVPNYGSRMAQRRQVRMAQHPSHQAVQQADYQRAPKEHYQQWAETGPDGNQTDQDHEEEKHDDSPRPKASRFVSKNADD